MTYTIFTTNTAAYNEKSVDFINRRHVLPVAREFGVVVKLGEARDERVFYVNGKAVGSVHCYPSNNGKFYATNARDWKLCHSFAEALAFALADADVTVTKIKNIAA